MKTSLQTITRLTTLLSQKTELVACNVYVSAGGRKQHTEPLLNLLKSSQKLCQQLRQKHNDNVIHEKNINNNEIAIVHAYADGPYDRSSFHLAGHAHNVAIVASHLALTAVDLLQSSLVCKSTDDGQQNNSKHPLVGIVDHISIMTLIGSSEKKPPQTQQAKDDAYIPPDTHGLAALYVAHKLSQRGVQCYTYGSANPNHTPLATIRKQKTSFFKSGGLRDSDNNIKVPKDENNILGICTIGSPSSFVENFNIRLTNNTSKKQAISLTKKVRERDGGVVGVEALTLPYSNNRFETACNLLQPNIGSSECVLKKVNEWIEEQEQQSNNDEGKSVKSNNAYKYYIDDAYRVGTTEEQCMNTLAKIKDSGFEVHDNMVRKNFENFLKINCEN